MILKSIRLHNIRSYENQNIEFPEGSFCLSGDIGSGKSTILLSIEFALFGLKKGDITGSTLLRHGSKEGYIELKLEINQHKLIIRRNLKRTSKDIKQDSGHIILNNSKIIGTSEELKSKILEILGYPKEYLKKKDLIYRYTVFTPQEEMKKIIYESKDLRLDTLRKVFNIDKYKRIIENSKILTSSLRDKKKSIEGYILDLEHKKLDLKNKQQEIQILENKLLKLLPKLELTKNNSDELLKKLKIFEDQISVLINLKQNLSVLETKFNNKLDQTKDNNNRITQIEEIITNLDLELKDKTITESKNINELISNKEKELSNIDNNYIENLKKIQEINSNVKIFTSTIEKIEKIDSCPMCEQNVSHTHKSTIKEREQKKITSLESDLSSFSKQDSDIQSSIKNLKEELNTLRKSSSDQELLKHKFNNLEDRKLERTNLQNQQEIIKKEVGQINLEKQKLFQEIEKLKEVEQQYKDIKQQHEDNSQIEKDLEIEKAKLEQEKFSNLEFTNNLKIEILAKEESSKQLTNYSKIQNYTQDFFIKLMSTIEKHVFTQIHNDFNEFFKEWFNILIEDENLSLNLDDEFTPIIQQNGYDTTIDNLSGGEKTAVALAYRLALNKVINDVISDINTKDLIMLDEPTDGFSSEQLDNVREVLTLLNMKQIVIVSHESKIESFVQNVIRVEKQGHVSSISTV